MKILLFILLIIICIAFYMWYTDRTIVILGFGGVGAAVVELWNSYGLCGKLGYFIIVEPRDIDGHIVLENKKYKHIKRYITNENLYDTDDEIYKLLHKPNQIIIDCTVNVDAIEIMKICNMANSLYINCSMEDWLIDNPNIIDDNDLLGRSLCKRIWDANVMFRTGPTMLVDQGMNPGIVSLFALEGIKKIAEETNNTVAINMIVRGKYAEAAQYLGVHTIHITENDTQQLNYVPPQDEFHNTWSPIGLVAEALDPIQIASIDNIPITSIDPNQQPIIREQHKNMQLYNVRGMDCIMQSWSPDVGQYNGYVIPHGEANTLSTKLSTGTYQPNVYFVYQPAQFARDALDRMRTNNYIPPEKYTTIPLVDIVEGHDAVGAAIYLNDGTAWWSGCILDVDYVRNMGMRWSGPTTIQVAIAVLSALRWMKKNSNEGFITPEYLPLEVLQDCKPYLGTVLFKKIINDSVF